MRLLRLHIMLLWRIRALGPPLKSLPNARRFLVPSPFQTESHTTPWHKQSFSKHRLLSRPPGIWVSQRQAKVTSSSLFSEHSA